MNGYESSREPSPTKSITEELPHNGKTGSKSRPGSPDDDRYRVKYNFLYNMLYSYKRFFTAI